MVASIFSVASSAKSKRRFIRRSPLSLFSPRRLGASRRKLVLNEDHIIPDTPDSSPWYIVLLASSKEAEKLKRSRNNDCHDFPFWNAQVKVADITEPAAIADVDNLLAAKLGKTLIHAPTSFPTGYAVMGTSDAFTSKRLALFCDFSVLNPVDMIAVFNRRQAVSNDDHRFLPLKMINGLHNLGFGLIIQR